MAKMTYTEFHEHVKVLAQKLRQQSFIPKYILAYKDGLIVASYLARKFQWHPIVLDSAGFSSRGVEGKILVLSFCSSDQQLKLMDTARLVLQDAVTTIVSAAIVEVSFPVNFSASDLPEEIDAPWA